MNNLIEGKVFRTAEGEEFGIIRASQSPGPDEIQTAGWTTFAEDGCGNFFVRRNDSFAFWDHETSEMIHLAVGEGRFLAGIGEPAQIELEPGQIKRLWIDPDFSREMGLIEERTDESK